MKRLLCIWLPNWPIQRLVAARPELSSRPVLLYARRGAERADVVACSSAARRHGAHAGMPLVEAASLAEKHSPHIQAHDPGADRQALEQLAAWCEQFSPLVGLEEGQQSRSGSADRQPECLLLDVTGLRSLSGEPRLAKEVSAAFSQRGYGTHAALADTLGAAWAAAHFCVCPAVIPPGQTRQALSGLPVESLRLSEQTVRLLHQLGILRVEQLLRLPRSGLSARFGDRLLVRLDQVLGRVPEVIRAYRPPPQWQAEWALEEPTGRREVLEQVVARLVQRLAEQVGQRDEGILQFTCRLDCTRTEFNQELFDQELSDPPPLAVQLRIDLFRPTAVPQHLLELLRTQLDRLVLPGPVQRVEVQAVSTAPLKRQQGELFADRGQPGGRQLSVLVDRLSSRLGSESVVRPQLVADAQPERAFGYEPFTGRSPHRRLAAAPACCSLPGPLQRPLRLHLPPLPLPVVSIVPDGPPVRFAYQNRSHRVTRHWGPERIETGWWRGPSVRRDYYRVETDSGHRFWLFRRLEDGTWFLQGEFG